MTNQQQSTRSTPLTIDYTDGAPLDPHDPRAAMARAVQAARAVVAEVNEANADEPTPCTEWNAGDVARHLVAVLDRAAAGPTDRDIISMPLLADVPIADLDDALLGAAQRLHATWTDDATLQMMITVPWGDFPGAVVIGTYATETLIHAWDLAQAIGAEPNWPESDVATGYEMLQFGIPESPRDETMPFDPVVRPEPDAPMIEHLVGWTGRSPLRGLGGAKRS